jgi:hypothetical protein
MLVRPNNGAVNAEIFIVGIAGQRNGAFRSNSSFRKNWDNIPMTEEDWQIIYQRVNAPKPAEPVPIPQKSMGSVLKDFWQKLFPKKEEKSGNDIKVMSWDELGH